MYIDHKTKFIRYFFLFCLIFGALNFGFSQPIHAAGLSIDPPVTEILLSPTTPGAVRLTLTNPEATPATFTLALHAVRPSDAAGHLQVIPEPLGPTTLPLTVSLRPGSESGTYTLAPGAALPVTLTLEAPTGAETSDSYFALVATLVDAARPPENRVTTQAGLAGIILVSTVGDGVIPMSVKVADFPLPTLHDSWLPLRLTPTIKNESRTMLRLSGELQIQNAQGRLERELPLYPDLVLGGSERTFSQSNEATPAGKLPLVWQPSLLSVGPHTIRLTLTTVGGTTILESEKIVWIFPIRLTFLVVLILFTGTTTILLLRHRHT